MYEKLIAMVEGKLNPSEFQEFEVLLNEVESVAYDAGYDAGKEEGYDMGSTDRYAEGYEEGISSAPNDQA